MTVSPSLGLERGKPPKSGLVDTTLTESFWCRFSSYTKKRETLTAFFLKKAQKTLIFVHFCEYKK